MLARFGVSQCLDNFRFPRKFRFSAPIRLKFFLGRGSGSVEVGFKFLGNTRGTFKTRECAG